MAKEIKKIAPHLCLQSLTGHTEAVSGLMGIMDELIQYVEETPSENQPLKDFFIKNLKKHVSNVNSFQVYE